MAGLIIVVVLSAALHNAQSQLSYMGPYCVINKGFTPHNYIGVDPDAAIEYKTWVSPGDYLMHGEYWFHRYVKTLGLVITADRKDINGGGGTVNSGQKFVYENVCEMKEFPFDPFRERFTGIFDENCGIEPGHYFLKNWSIEFHMRPKLTHMLYGDYTFHVCWIEGGNKDKCIVKNTLRIIFDKASKKEAMEKSEMIRSGAKKGKSKKKGGNS